MAEDSIKEINYTEMITFIQDLLKSYKNSNMDFRDQKSLEELAEAIQNLIQSAQKGQNELSLFLYELSCIQKKNKKEGRFTEEKEDFKNIKEIQKIKKEMRIFTKKGKEIYFGKCLGRGAEGSVFKIPNMPGKAAKIYHTSKISEQKEKKIEALMKSGISPRINNVLVAALPEETLYWENEKFAGYVMPQIVNSLKIYDICRDSSERKKFFPDLDFRGMIAAAYNLAEVIDYFHKYDIVIGDMNMNNIVVYPDGTVCLIDCDSFDLYDKEKKIHYPCKIALPELLAPELQKIKDLTQAEFTKESDNFSLAIYIFRLLMNNADPFSSESNIELSQEDFTANDRILHGECVYVKEISGKKIPSWAPSFETLPQNIQTLFQRVFDYDFYSIEENKKNRPKAEEWMRALMEFFQMPLKQCKENPFHLYLPKYEQCPFCHGNPERDEEKRSERQENLWK